MSFLLICNLLDFEKTIEVFKVMIRKLFSHCLQWYKSIFQYFELHFRLGTSYQAGTDTIANCVKRAFKPYIFVIH